MPLMNSKQQLAALYPDFCHISVADRIAILQEWKEVDFFEKLPSVQVMLRLDHVELIPTDLDTRLPVSRINLCVPETLCADKEAQVKLKYFVSQGFRLFVDEFASANELLWDATKVVAVDCSENVPFSVKPWLLRLHSGQHWAKNLNKSADLDQAIDAGFKLFSGDYAFYPPEKNKTSDGSARTRLLKLLGLVARDAESRELEELFKQDTTLSFMLLKLVSSAAFAQTVRVTSFGQAINLLGRRQLQRWLQLLLYARQQDSGGGLNPLMPRAAFRASFMEAVCQKNGGNKDQLDCAFMVGMFSLLDKLFGSDLSQVLEPLNLHDDVMNALLHKTGMLGECLQLTEYADRRNAGNHHLLLPKVGLDSDAYFECLIHAYVWVNQVCRDM